ncbi:hypothetical protein FRC02_004720 [Tulasnella sp. 418]|nr:hypothetical protein FRC02_004720 [Tulasnella sp. 418]
MAISQKVSEYLSKRIQVDNEVVTFRLLSRELRIHVNEAKNELARFYHLSKNSAPVHATYLLSGEVVEHKQPPAQSAGSNTAVEQVPSPQAAQLKRKIVLIGETDVEQAKLQFSRIICTHVYSLSPGMLNDKALLASATASIRQLDAEHGPEVSATLGMAIAPCAKVVKFKPSTKPLPKPVVKPMSGRPSLQEKNTDQEKRASSTLQQSKLGKKPEAAKKVEPAVKPNPFFTATKATPKVTVKKEPSTVKLEEVETKLGRNVNESEEENSSKAGSSRFQSPSQGSSAFSQTKGKVKRGRVVSDDEEEEPVLPTKKSSLKKRKSEALREEEEEEEEENAGTSRKLARLMRGQAAAEQQRSRKSEKEDNLRALMELDDDNELSSAARTSEEPEEESEPEHVPLTKPQKSKAKPAKEKPTGVDVINKTKKRKSTVPLGNNGKKKRKVMKTRETVNAKGYTVTEDYSSYESVSGSEEEEEKPKPKASSQKKRSGKVVKQEEEEEEDEQPSTFKSKLKPDAVKDTKSNKAAPPTKRPSVAKNAGPKGLMSYFGKK